MSPKESTLLKRGSGVLLHISSLPSPYGIGDFGPQAFQFVDFLHEAGQSYWQVLPLNPTDGVYGHSPYSSHSAFAGNTLFISPQEMVKEGWLADADLDSPPFSGDAVHYERVLLYKKALYEKAYLNFQKTNFAVSHNSQKDAIQSHNTFQSQSL